MTALSKAEQALRNRQIALAMQDAPTLIERLERVERVLFEEGAIPKPVAAAKSTPAPQLPQVDFSPLEARILKLEQNQQQLVEALDAHRRFLITETLQEIRITSAKDPACAALMERLATALGVSLEQAHAVIQTQRTTDLAGMVELKIAEHQQG
jgi:hypothetical protein